MRAVASISNSVYHLVNKFCIVAVVFVGQGEILIIDQHLQTINHSLQNKKLCYILTLLNCSQLKYKTSVKRNDLYRTLLVMFSSRTSPSSAHLGLHRKTSVQHFAGVDLSLGH